MDKYSLNDAQIIEDLNLTDAQIIEDLKWQNKELQDINQKNIEHIRQLDTDQLTGLLTKEAFFRDARNMLDTYPNEKFVFLRLDIDKFQTVNTLFGYEEGDRLLKHCAKKIHLINSVQLLSIAGHIDADIFCICCKVDSTYDVESLLHTDIDNFLKSYRDDYRFNISIGLYYIQDNTESTRSIYSRATIASRKCKDSSEFYLYQYDAEIDRIVLRNQLISAEMHSALDNGEFVPFLQPKVDLQTGKLIGAEALVRWLHPKQGLILPNDFIPLFEQNGFISKLDRNVFKQVCAFIRGWLDVGIEPVPISVNLSQFNFTNQDLASEIISILNEYGVDKEYIHFEITESAYSIDTKQTLHVTNKLAAQGLHLEMDDFGTSISSLTMLNDLPVKTLKLDLRFIQSRAETHNNGNILNFIVSLAKQMQIDLIVEGIETEDQLSFLKNIGCSYGQGYLFSKPVPKEEFEKLLTKGEILHTSKTETDITSMLDMDDLWFPNSKFNLLFNILVGGVAIYEVNNITSNISILRTNDDYLTILDLSREDHEQRKNNISKYIVKEDLVILKKKISESIQNDNLLTAEMRSISFLIPKKITWIKFSARIIVRTKEKTLFLANLENITAEKEIAEYRKREAKIHEDYKKQLSIYQDADSNGVATMLIDNGMTLVYANDEFLKMYEYSREYAFSHADTIIAETVHPEDLHVVDKALKSLLVKKSDHFEWTMRICTSKGAVRSTLVSGLVRYEDDGIYTDIVVRDITDIKSLKERLESSESCLRQIALESSPTVWDVKTKICYWSNAMQVAYQLPPTTEDFPDKLCEGDYIRQDSKEILLNIFDQMIHKNKNIIVADLWIKNSTFKHYISQKITFVAERNEAGDVVRINGAGADVVKKASEQKYFELNQILANIPGCVVVISSATASLSYANNSYFNLIGYSREEVEKLLHNDISMLMHPDDLKENKQQIYENFMGKGELCMTGRCKRKDGKELWIRIDGKKIDEEIFCVITDETDIKHNLLELEAERQFNKTITSLSNDIFFHFNLKNNKIRFSGTLAHEYMPDMVYENFTQYALEGDIGVTEDLHNFVALMDAMNSGKEIASEFRFKNKNGQASWFRIEYRIVFDNKIPAYAIGKFTNIDVEKNLTIKAETDSLTTLYNKGTTQHKIEQALIGSNTKIKNVLFIIDIDNFKYVNDTFGHQFGDVLLFEVATTMKNLFRGNDFVGRLGGDEFMIFMHNIRNETVIKQKANMLLSALHAIKVGDTHRLTVSIGIALFPKNGQTYEELYSTADIALYNAKNAGKDCFFLYKKGMTMNNLQKKTEIDQALILEQGFDRNIVFKVFEMLQSSQNLSATVNEIMSMVGTFFAVDRSYIFKKRVLSDGKIVYDNTYEWCGEGIEPAIDELQEVPHEAYASVWAQYDSKGVFMCNDITKLEQTAFELLNSQGIKSVLQCVVRQNKEIKLMFGFDACSQNREWKMEEASTLLYITQILGGHLLKKK